MWIARDKDGELYLYNEEPCRDNDFEKATFWHIPDDPDGYHSLGIDSKLFPKLKWEDDAIEVKIVEVEKKKETKIEKSCRTCKFINESPRCMTGKPCNEWRERKTRKG